MSRKAQRMADSIIQPNTQDSEESNDLVAKATDEGVDATAQEKTTPAVTSLASSNIIWTPRFIVIFSLFLVTGLSLDSLLTQGWANRNFTSAWPLLGHMIVASGFLVAIIIVAHSWWMRLGSIFGCLWAIFSGINIVLSLSKLDPTSPYPAYLNAATCSALLGCYICLSVERPPITTWDRWFFRLAFLAGISAAVLAFFITPATGRSLSALESDFAAAGLVLCVLVWWIRPSCWKTRPGPTLFFGLTPIISLLLSIPGKWNGEANLYFLLLTFFCFMLGSIRLIQGELRN